MGYTLRPYQNEAIASAVAYFKQQSAAACIVLPTGAGKSLVIAELGRLARGRVLVLAHVKELCEQNQAKHTQLGIPAGLYVAGLGRRDTGCAITHASVQSVVRNLDDFNGRFSLLVIDECHRVSDDDGSQYATVIAALKRENPTLKILGLTATPYRMQLGWIYRYHADGRVRSDEARPFETCIYEVSLRRLLADGYLTPATIIDATIAQYDFSQLATPAGDGQRDDEVNRLLTSHRRVTEAIVQQVQELADSGKRRGVLLFAATVEHAREIVRYLPEGETALVLGETPGEERDAQIAAFRRQERRFLVNVAVLTTGFDVPHVDMIAILRPTESVSLFQQMVGRGLRLSPGKRDCLVIDYAGNGFDLFHPEVGEPKYAADSVPVEVPCPACGFANLFWGKRDAAGNVSEHYGRRCQNLQTQANGTRERCEYRFRFKECSACFAENDNAARRCHACDELFTDPDDQLRRALRLKDACVLRVTGLTLTVSGSILAVCYHDEDGTSLSERFDFSRAAELAAFNRIYPRRLASGSRPMRLTTTAQALALEHAFTPPDFVVARKAGRFFRVQARIFDYRGRYRKGNEL